MNGGARPEVEQEDVDAALSQIAIAHGRPSPAVRAGALTQQLRRSPIRSALVAAGLIAIAVGAFALRPVPITFTQDGQLIHIQCGADTYFSGYPDDAIDHACHHAYRGHVGLVVGAAVVALLGAGAAGSIALSSATGTNRRRVALLTAAAALAGIAIVSLRPVVVSVGDPRAPATVSCGIDSYLAGYPDPTVQSACRSHYGSRAVTAFAAGVGMTVLLVLASHAASRRDNVSSPTLSNAAGAAA